MAADSTGGKVISRACLLYAHYTMEVLDEQNIQALIQAGDGLWERMTPEQDDGVSPTHFGYEWSPGHPNSQRSMRLGLMPEIHIWLGFTQPEMVLIDLSTRHVPEACRVIMDLDWLAPRPPDYVWHSGEMEGMIYRPKRAATLYAMTRIWQLFRPDYLAKQVDVASLDRVANGLQAYAMKQAFKTN